MTKRVLTNGDLRESRSEWLNEIYVETPKGKESVCKIREIVQNKFGGISKEETGRIVKLAFPNIKRKKHHGGTSYFYEGISERESGQSTTAATVPDAQPNENYQEIVDVMEKERSTLQANLGEEKAHNAIITTELEQLGALLEEKNAYCAEIESKLDEQSKEAQEVEKAYREAKLEVETITKQRMLTVKQLQLTQEKLDVTKSRLTDLKSHYKESCKTTSATSQSATTHDLPVIASNQLVKETSTSGRLGSGSFGDCYLRQYRNIEVCIKYCRESSRESVIREAEFIRKLQGHPNLPILFGVSPIKQDPPYIVTKFHGDQSSRKNTLYNALSSNLCIYSVKSFTKLALQCGKALMHMHNCRILHNDLKTNNVVVDLVDSEPSAVIIDFGKSCYVDKARCKHIPLNERDEYKTNYPHIAPELVNGTCTQSFASDIYSYGILLSKVNKITGKLDVAVQISTIERLEKRGSIDTIIGLIRNAILTM